MSDKRRKESRRNCFFAVLDASYAVALVAPDEVASVAVSSALAGATVAVSASSFFEIPNAESFARNLWAVPRKVKKRKDVWQRRFSSSDLGLRHFYR